MKFSKIEKIGIAIAIAISVLLLVFLSFIYVKIENVEYELSKVIEEQQEN